MRKHAKIVLVGDGGCGKTCLLQVFKDDTFPSVYVPTIVDNFVKTVEYKKEKLLTLTIWDTSGQNGFETMRPLSYRDTDLFLLCYSINHRKELNNIETKWLLEVKNYSPTSSYIMVGLKSDLRDNENNNQDNENNNKENENKKIVTEEETKQLAERINANGYIECSALTRYNVDNVFKLVAKIINEKNNEKNNEDDTSCCGWCFKWC